MSFKSFYFNILNGMATGIVVALIPNAMLGELFKYLSQYHELFTVLTQYLMMFQFSASIIIGVLAGYQLKFNGIQSVILGGAAFIGSGAVQFTDKGASLAGMGDLLNMLLTITVAALVIRALGNRLGTLNIVFLPILAGVLPGAVGTFTLPYMKMVTGSLGQVIAHFTTLNPLVMCILICTAYALLMATPISLVAIATVISLSGLGSGAANLGITACCYTFIVGSWFVNDKGVNTTLVIGAAKMMMPVYVRHPIIMVPLIINGIVGGTMAYFMGVQGTPMSAGFGYTGLVGPLNAFKYMDSSALVNVLKLLAAYVLVPLPVSILAHTVLLKILPGYHADIYQFNKSE
ncbi:PTS transporter subunit IIC [Macrococcus equipercicus]|nr:PTS sugar transporter subunit IIC [Macrococcus equipercicus]